MENVTKPFRLGVAQTLCRALPPLISQRVRGLIYPLERAYQDDFEFIVASQTGSFFRSRTSDFHGYAFSVHGYYEWRNWAIALALCHPGDTIIEIGANIGTETIGFRDIVGETGRVFAFEPLPSNLQALQQILSLNCCRNVTVLPLALGRSAGTAQFVVPDKKGASGIGHFVSNGETASQTIDVTCEILDALAAKVGVAKIIFIDTEGAETDVLDGASEYIATHRPAVVLEASPRLLARAGSSLDKLHEKIKALGLAPFVISRLGLAPVQNLDASQPANNWLCLPFGEAEKIQRVRRFLTVCGLLPCISGLNPLSKIRR